MLRFIINIITNREGTHVVMTRACAITENRDISFLYNNKSYANAHDEDSSVTKIIRESVKLLLKYILYSVHIIIKGKKAMRHCRMQSEGQLCTLLSKVAVR